MGSSGGGQARIVETENLFTGRRTMRLIKFPSSSKKVVLIESLEGKHGSRVSTLPSLFMQLQSDS